MKFQMNKKTITILCAIVLAGVVGYRIYNLVTENAFVVYNISREYKKHGTPVEAIVAKTENGTLTEPLYVKNGRAYVSANRRSKFAVGNTVGENGKITSVSNNVDLDTGLYVIRVSGASGDVLASRKLTGVFVPNAAVQTDGTVLIVDGDIAVARPITIVASDADNSVVRGLNDGDVVILSKVEPGTLVKIAE